MAAASRIADEQLMSVQQSAYELNVTPKRVYQLIKEKGLQVETRHGVKHLLADDVEKLKEGRGLLGRPRTPVRPGELPSASPETLDEVLRVLEQRVLSPTGRDYFRRARGGRISLDSDRWELSSAVRGYLTLAVRAISWEAETDGRNISYQEAERIAARIRKRFDYEDGGFFPGRAPEDTAPEDRKIPVVLDDDPAIAFLSFGKGIRLNQTLVIYGCWGTGKTRLAAMLAVRTARAHGREVWYYTLESHTAYMQQLLEETVEAWRDTPGVEDQPAAPVSKARYTPGVKARHADSMPKDDVPAVEVLLGDEEAANDGRVPLRIYGAVAAWDEVRDELLKAMKRYRDPASEARPPVAVIIDSLGPLENIRRSELDYLLSQLHQQSEEMLVVLVGEEAAGDQPHAPALTHALWTADMVWRTRLTMPEGREASTTGVGRRVVEIYKSRQQPFLEGRHALTLAHGKSALLPAVTCWFNRDAVVTRAIDRSLEARDTYTPGLVLRWIDDPKHPGKQIPDPADPLWLVNKALGGFWNRGGSLALVAGEKCEKDLLGLYGVANALAQGFSGLVINMRADYLHTLREWSAEDTEVFPRLTCFAPDFPDGSAAPYAERVRPLRLDTAVGARPEIYVLAADPGMLPEEFLWTIYSAIARSHAHPGGAPIACLAWNHYSEMIGNPGYRDETDFTPAALRMCHMTGVSTIINVDPDSYRRHLADYHLPNTVPIMDARWDLRPGEERTVRLLARNNQTFVLGRRNGDGQRFLGAREKERGETLDPNDIRHDLSRAYQESGGTDEAAQMKADIAKLYTLLAAFMARAAAPDEAGTRG